MVIEWPNKDAKKRKSMENDTQKGFLGCVRKIDSIDIILKNKSRGVYNREIFFT